MTDTRSTSSMPLTYYLLSILPSYPTSINDKRQTHIILFKTKKKDSRIWSHKYNKKQTIYKTGQRGVPRICKPNKKNTYLFI